MPEPIQFDQVADIYDYYVNVDFDVPFFLRESENYNGEILELMCGTGRVSLPLLKAGRQLVCVDYSQGMLDTFRNKIEHGNYPVTLIQSDVTELNLRKRFGLVLLPFHSLSEILSSALQRQTLQTISAHLDREGVLILTLQNPAVRLKTADAAMRILGEFSAGPNRKMIISYINQYDPSSGLVSGYQFFELYDNSNELIEKRYLPVNFKPISHDELRNMIKSTGLEIANLYGDYNYGKFEKDNSMFMVYRIIKT